LGESSSLNSRGSILAAQQCWQFRLGGLEDERLVRDSHCH
jgi:hypothetical protein